MFDKDRNSNMHASHKPVTLGEFRSEILISDVTSMGEGVYGPPMTYNLLTKDNTGIDDWYEVYPNINATLGNFRFRL